MTVNLINLFADEGEPIDNLFAGQRKEELVCSMKSEHMLEKPKDQLQTQSWKGLFKIRTLPRFTIWVFVENLQKNRREGAHGQEPMKSFKLRSLMQEHRLMKMNKFG